MGNLYMKKIEYHFNCNLPSFCPPIQSRMDPKSGPTSKVDSEPTSSVDSLEPVFNPTPKSVWHPARKPEPISKGKREIKPPGTGFNDQPLVKLATCLSDQGYKWIMASYGPISLYEKAHKPNATRSKNHHNKRI